MELSNTFFLWGIEIFRFFVVSQIVLGVFCFAVPQLLKIANPSLLSKLLRALVLFLFVAQGIFWLLPAENFSGGIVKIDAGVSRPEIVSSQERAFTISATDSKDAIRARSFPVELIFGLFLISVLFGFLRFTFLTIRNYQKFYHLKGQSIPIRKIGRISIYLCPLSSSAFSVKIFLRHYVMVPFSYLENQTLFKNSLSHEIYHIRSRDTQWVYFWMLYRSLFWFSPMTSKILKEVTDLTEQAVDYDLITRNRVNRRTYGQSLLEATMKIEGPEAHFKGAMTMASSPSQLKRRISSMKNYQSKTTNRFLVGAISCLLIIFIAGLSFAAQSGLVDRRITRSDANRMAQATSSSDIPIVITDKVMTWLNRGAGTERGRFYLRSVFKNMKRHEKLVLSIIRKRGLPEELVVVPFIESGFQNYDNGIAAGIWSITPATGRALGLRIDDRVDERFDIEKSTHAALDYLVANYNRFGTWYHSMVAYNTGERFLEDLMNKEGHTDVFRLVREGKLGRRSQYLPKAMAGLVVLNNRDLVKK